MVNSRQSEIIMEKPIMETFSTVDIEAGTRKHVEILKHIVRIYGVLFCATVLLFCVTFAIIYGTYDISDHLGSKFDFGR